MPNSDLSEDLPPPAVAERTLGEACDSGDLALVQSVLAQCQNDPSIDEQVRPRLTSYVWNTASGGHADIVSYLLDNGAEIGASPLATTRQKDTDKAIRVFDVLFDHGLDLKTYRDGSELIHRVVNNEAFVKYLLLKGADPNGLENWERTPLDCFCDNPASIITLIDHSANIATGK